MQIWILLNMFPPFVSALTAINAYYDYRNENPGPLSLTSFERWLSCNCEDDPDFEWYEENPFRRRRYSNGINVFHHFY